MLIFVTGGASSGKSALAEQYCTRLGEKLLYVATMQIRDPESRSRVKRHRSLRGDRFQTIESPHSLQKLRLNGFYDAILLECMGNLVANELYDRRIPPDSLVDYILNGVTTLNRQAASLVVVSNEVFGDTVQYGAEMQDYLHCVGRISQRMAAAADVVVESVCGLPVFWKGREMIE